MIMGARVFKFGIKSRLIHPISSFNVCALPFRDQPLHFFNLSLECLPVQRGVRETDDP